MSTGAGHETGVRIEQDSLGSVAVPTSALWGIHTERAILNFPVSGIQLGSHRHLVRALAVVKKAAALTNTEIGLIPADIGHAIVTACDTVAAGKVDEAFPVDVIQGGAGTSTNMNANEVIANLALQSLGHPRGSYDVIDPIGHVNKCQSTNDVYPTALRLALVFALEDLLERLALLSAAFAERGNAFAAIPKVGRTQLQDAVPMTLGQEFTAFAVTLEEDQRRLHEAAALLRECSLGATAIGTGITADPRYVERVIDQLAAVSGVPLTRAHDFVEATWDTGAFMTFSGALKRTAIKLSKICSDLRLLSSGPQTGLAEIRLPPRQAGSSIMPGKVNPVIPEVINQIAFYVAGADVTVTMAADNGQLQLNAFEPVIAHALLQSMGWLANGCDILRELCVTGIEANEPLLRSRSQASTAQVTALVPYLGYSAAAGLAHRAEVSGQDVLELAIIEGLMPHGHLKTLANAGNDNLSGEPACQ
ncbi:UNVERIFIED_ORG: aspartate ammonia-lyase [Paenarthrobacter nicotinovorans]|uniref:aspartate ammonia-lyase n=1 Tax=Paenarthrobacter histidinolovorans TaxID=43664 RepID=UPI0016659344|nr:aspartate ammonia-lyase [Paenarthrobacter histidinolovorans]GGJ23923.1 aspartate ammonia-lyase [Paenarthrobacter histidinolovorans]